jgi:hypothetical protein
LLSHVGVFHCFGITLCVHGFLLVNKLIICNLTVLTNSWYHVVSQIGCNRYLINNKILPL